MIKPLEYLCGVGMDLFILSIMYVCCGIVPPTLMSFCVPIYKQDF